MKNNNTYRKISDAKIEVPFFCFSFMPDYGRFMCQQKEYRLREAA